MDTYAAALIIEDDQDVLRAARIALSTRFESIVTTRDPNNLEELLTPGIEVVLLDMNFAAGQHSGGAGLDALARIQQVDTSVSVVLMTAFGSVSLAVEALKRGGVDFLLKPWRNEALVAAACAAAKRTRDTRNGATLDLEALERSAIERALAQSKGNISVAAAALGLSRPALYRRMSKHGLS
jgi:DNA-binding NtrC family response regulator